MAQPTLPTDKTFRRPVKLVSTDGVALPFKGFVLISEEQFVMFESVVEAAKHFLAKRREIDKSGFSIQKDAEAILALRVLSDRVGELEKVWGTPPVPQTEN